MTDELKIDRRVLMVQAMIAASAPLGGVAMAETTDLKPKLKPGANSVLIVVDIQNGFLPGGSLAVKKGDEIIPLVNKLIAAFPNVILTQDWHTPGHISFASSHTDKAPFDVIDLPYGKQVLWPDHCVQGTESAAFAKDLQAQKAQLIIRKGYNRAIDSYSAFMEADKTTQTGLAGYLNERGLNEIFVCGLATDYCVAWTAIDGARKNFKVYVIDDATRAIDLDGSLAAAWSDMAAAGVVKIASSDLELG